MAPPPGDLRPTSPTAISVIPPTPAPGTGKIPRYISYPDLAAQNTKNAREKTPMPNRQSNRTPSRRLAAPRSHALGKSSTAPTRAQGRTA
jgi:hypothetical protein